MRPLGELTLTCVAPDTVVPPANGSAARTFGLAAAVRPHVGGVTIECFSSEPAPAAPPAGLRVVHIPRPTRGAARAAHLLRMLLGPTLGYRFPRPLDGGGLVQLESPLLFEAARRAGLGPFVLDAHNVYQDMARFPAASLAERAFYRLTRARQARIEHACWAAAAHVLFCSEIDRARAERLAPGVATKSTLVPNSVDVTRFTPRPAAAFAAGGPVVFVGTMRYPPNFFALEEICRAIAPALPALSFWIVGAAGPRPSVVPRNVRFLGQVESTATPLAAAQVAIAPVRHGSGTRLKILEYMAAGVPVVCTAKAAEGLAVTDGRDVVLAETSAELARAIAALHADARRCAALGAAGRALVEARYDWAAQVPATLAAYRAALAAAR
ncbi:MAG TPA: glycosyltransferase family 4 protein [Methylomirabilota bacterium]|nr:glycosyltransferase family 4 protein [Methylomirabilota bacterium]